MEKEKWYNNASTITSLIIIVIALMIICSQSFVVVRDNSFHLFGSVINHNSIYFLILIYFVGIKFKIGKKYFNYLNVFLVFVYFLLSITSFLTIFQSLSLISILTFVENILLLVYLFHTMFRDTRIWKEFKLGNSPFNEIENDFYFNSLAVLVAISLVFNLISTVVVSGLFVSLLQACYVLLFSRYIYLYCEYLDSKKKDINNKGNFDDLKKELFNDMGEVKKVVSEISHDTIDKTKNLIEKSGIDKKIEDTKDKVDDKIKDITEEIKNKTKKNTKKKKISKKGEE